MRALEDVLQSTRLVNGKPRPHQDKYNNEKQKYENLHRHRIRNGGIRVMRFDVKNPQQPSNRAGEELIQERCKPELFVHSSLASDCCGVLRIRAPKPYTVRKLLRTRCPLRAETSPQRAHTDSREKH